MILYGQLDKKYSVSLCFMHDVAGRNDLIPYNTIRIPSHMFQKIYFADENHTYMSKFIWHLKYLSI